MASAVAAAFDREAAVYDATFGRNPVGLLFRHSFQERLRQRFAPGTRVVDLGCGTGEDALFLAARGVMVLGLDPSTEMVAACRAKARERGIGEERARFERGPAESVQGTFDGAFSDFGALNCADLAAAGRALAAALRPGAPVVLSLMGGRPLPAVLYRALTGRGADRRRVEPRVGGLAIPVTYPTPNEVRARLGPDFLWHDAFALGVLVPGPDHAGWAERHPQAFGALAAVEAVVRRWPLLRNLGDHFVLEGVRR